MRVAAIRILAAASILAIAGVTTSSAVMADTPATSPRLTELEAEHMVVRSEIEQLGNSTSPTNAVNNVQTEANELDGVIGRMEEVASQLGATADELRQLSEEYGETGVLRLSDVPEEAKEEALFQCIKRVCTRYGVKAAARLAGWLPYVGDAFAYGGRLVVREINEARIREMARQQLIQRSHVFDLLSALRCQRQERRAAVTRLQELQRRERALANEIAEERQRAAERLRQAERANRASRNAVRDRTTDYPGDLEEWRKHQANPPTRRAHVGPATPTQGAMNVSPFAREILAVHSAERLRFGVEPLEWNPALEASATAHAQEMARTGLRLHASRAGRGIERENISQGMLHWNTSQMLNNWLQERGKFTPGVFPNVCAGDWSQCAHYTQMLWPTTTDVGCGMASGSGFKWLVCRYSPGGNKDGLAVGTPEAAAQSRLAMIRRAC